jgi:hypothetical protein
MSGELIEQFVELAGGVMEEVKDIRSSLVRIDCGMRDDGDNTYLEALPLIASGLQGLANAITPSGVAPAPDANGGFVASLTEAVMGCSAGLAAIANAIDRLACAIEATGSSNIGNQP